MRVNITISGLAACIALLYQEEGQSKEVQEANQKDFPRVVYNVKQIAFNASTISAIAVAIFTVIRIVAFPYGIVMTGLFWGARTLVEKEIEKMLLTTNGKVAGLLAQAVQKYVGVPTLENPGVIWGHINSNRPASEWQALREDWEPAPYKIQDIPIWRNLVLLEDLKS